VVVRLATADRLRPVMTAVGMTAVGGLLLLAITADRMAARRANHTR
jgi:hypothetical protein